jgi:hypothetical protein
MIPSCFSAIVCNCDYVITARSFEAAIQALRVHQDHCHSTDYDFKHSYTGTHDAWKREAPPQRITH